MDYLEIIESPEGLRDPVLITGFFMRRRAGRLGARVVSHLVEQWKARPVARIDLAPFVNMAVYRPDVRRTETEASIEWPEATLYLASPPNSQRDIFLLSSIEPDFRWRAFVETATNYLDGLGVRTLLSLRARLGEVPHTRPAPVYVTSTDIELELQFGVQSTRTRQEGPSSVAGALATRAQAMRWKAAELAVVQPDYFPRMPNAEAMVALIRLIDKAFGTTTDIDELLQTVNEQREMLDRATASDSSTRFAIAEREQSYDAGLEKLDFLAMPLEESQDELPSGDVILREVERLFRGEDRDD